MRDEGLQQVHLLPNAEEERPVHVVRGDRWQALFGRLSVWDMAGFKKFECFVSGETRGQGSSTYCC